MSRLVLLVGPQTFAASVAEHLHGRDEVTVHRTSFRQAPSHLAEAGYILADCPNDDDGQALDRLTRLVDQAAGHAVPVAAVFQRVTEEEMTRVILRPNQLDLPLVVDALDHPGPVIDAILEAVADPPPTTGAVAIGSRVTMPEDHDEYERERTLSLVSPQMQSFTRVLKAALGQMDRRTPDGLHLRPPWDPNNRGPSWLDHTEGGPALNKPPGGPDKPNLRDVLAAHESTKGRELLDGARQLEQAPAWRQTPPKLLILGESGTGKSLVARLVHRLLTEPGPKQAGPAPLVRISCAGLGAGNLDHELFGATPGTWTGVEEVAGKLVQAAYGTAFLDEIGDLPLDSQARVLTFLDDLMLHPSGMQPFFGFLHVIAATNRDLRHRTALRDFRHDLLARFQLRVTLPPLRDRRGEIPYLVDFIAQHPEANPAVKLGPRAGQRSVTHLTQTALDRLTDADYRQGNFRELQEVVHRALDAARQARSPVITADHIHIEPPAFRPDADEHVIRIGEENLTQLAGDRPKVTIADMEEMRRLAARLDRPILTTPSGAHGLILDGDLAYLYLTPDTG